MLNDSLCFALLTVCSAYMYVCMCRCEVMTSCGWGKRVPAESHGLPLLRHRVLQYFLELRRSGMRAHIWP